MFLKLGIMIGLAIIDGLVNIITGGINWLIDQLNKIPFMNIGHIPPLNLAGQFAKSAFADGGFPMQGQMFIAREAGAELVGNVGGRTAVMNNDQIVESLLFHLAERPLFTSVLDICCPLPAGWGRQLKSIRSS